MARFLLAGSIAVKVFEGQPDEPCDELMLAFILIEQVARVVGGDFRQLLFDTIVDIEQILRSESTVLKIADELMRRQVVRASRLSSVLKRVKGRSTIRSEATNG
jgi:hypothetical protein